MSEDLDFLLSNVSSPTPDDPYDEILNPEGIIQKGLAENQLCFDLSESWPSEHPDAAAFQQENASVFKEIALFQDYYGLPAFKNALAEYMSEIRGNRVRFDPNKLVLNAGATSANETQVFCLANPGEALLLPTPYYPGFDRDLKWRTGVEINPIHCSSSNGFQITNEWTRLKQTEFEFWLALNGEENVAKQFPGMTQQQVQEHFAFRHSVNMPKEKEKVVLDSIDVKGKGLLSPGEPQKNGPIRAYRKRLYEVQVLDKNEEKKVHDCNNMKGKEMLPEPEPEKEKTSKRKGIWSEKEKGLFRLGLLKYGEGKWKKISEDIGTRLPEQVRSYARRRRRPMGSIIQDIQSLPPETNIPIANPGHLPLPRTVYDYVPIMEPMVRASNVPPPIRRDLPLLRPEHGLHDIYGNFGGSVCHPSSSISDQLWNLRAEMGANPSSSISDQLWNSTNTLSSDSCGFLPGPFAYGNNMNPGQ